MRNFSGHKEHKKGGRRKLGRFALLICALFLPLSACSSPSEAADAVNVTLPPEAAGYAKAPPEAADISVQGSPLPSPAVSPSPSLSPSPTPIPPTPSPSFPLKHFKYEPAGYVTGHDVNLRSGPGTEYAVIGRVDYHDIVKLIAESGDWYYVEAGDKRGFVIQDFVAIGDPEDTPDPTKKAATPSPKATEKPKYSDEEIYMAAQMIYLEAKGGSYKEYEAIASVLYNRIASRRFPNTVEGNIFAEGQFSVADDRDWFLAQKPDSASKKAARSVLNGDAPTLPAEVMYFRAADKGTSWGSREYYDTIGEHCFFK